MERHHRPVPTIKTPKPSGRPISERIASATVSGSPLHLDPRWPERLRREVAPIKSHKQFASRVNSGGQDMTISGIIPHEVDERFEMLAPSL